jgi:hypothetical protein
LYVGTQPQSPCGCVLGEYECADGKVTHDVEQRWVATSLRFEIVTTEANCVGTSVIVNRQVNQLFVARPNYLPGNELPRQHTVASSPRHIVDAVLREDYVADEQSKTGCAVRPPSQRNRPVLVTIGLKEMG